MSVIQTPMARLLEHADPPPHRRRLSDGSWMVRCPNHDDRTPSLHLTETETGDVLVYCQACGDDATSAILAHWGMTTRDLYAEPRERPNGQQPRVLRETVYDYHDEHGRLSFQVVRLDLEPDETGKPRKTFRQRSLHHGRWIDRAPLDPVLYRLPEIIAADPETPIFLVEGESNADALRQRGLIATTAPGGANKWRHRYCRWLKDKTVVAIQDNDEPGDRWAAELQETLPYVTRAFHAIDVKAVVAKPTGDIKDFLDQGGDLAAFLRERTILPKVPLLESGSNGQTVMSRPDVYRFRSAKAFATESDPEVPWVVEPWLAVGAVTKLDGAPKAAGKTTFALHMAKAIVQGGTFLGIPVAQAPVIMVSEEADVTLRAAFETAGLLDEADFWFSTFADFHALDIGAVIAGAFRAAETRGAKLIIFDTLPAVARLYGELENSSGAAREVMDLINMQRALYPCAVLVMFHDRKSGGVVGESGRGSSGFVGAVDVVLQLAANGGAGGANPNVRQLTSRSRFPQTPQQTFINLTERGYENIGGSASVVVLDIKDALRSVLPTDARLAMRLEDHTNGHLLIEAGMLSTLKEHVKRCSRSSAQRAIDEGVTAGWIGRTGSGKPRDPYRYYRTDDSAQDTAQSSRLGVLEWAELPAAPAWTPHVQDSIWDSPFAS